MGIPAAAEGLFVSSRLAGIAIDTWCCKTGLVFAEMLFLVGRRIRDAVRPRGLLDGKRGAIVIPQSLFFVRVFSSVNVDCPRLVSPTVDFCYYHDN